MTGRRSLNCRSRWRWGVGEAKILTREEVESLDGFTGTCWEAERSLEHFTICDRLTGDTVIDASGWQDDLPNMADARLMTWAPNLRVTCLYLFAQRDDIANNRAEWVARAMLAEKQVERLRLELACERGRKGPWCDLGWAWVSGCWRWDQQGTSTYAAVEAHGWCVVVGPESETTARYAAGRLAAIEAASDALGIETTWTRP